MKNKKLFKEALMRWHRKENKRMMPWKGEKEPYKVWLSEIILQQTRVEQGWSYYEKFVTAYPAITDLANAKDEDVFKLWEGLGYYTRCKNLLHTARCINEKYAGQFPSDYNSILNLKGIGAYTASAIASFCFNLPYAVVDGNVLRVLSRYFGVDIPVDTSEGKNYFTHLANLCLDKKEPGEYNQSIMDFGATICKPAPLCNICPLRISCVAFNKNKISILPVKLKKPRKRERWFSYFIFIYNEKKFVRQRSAKDIWQNLYEFYLFESVADPVWNNQKIKKYLLTDLNIKEFKSTNIIKAQPQTLTHQQLFGYFIVVKLNGNPASFEKLNGEWLSQNEIKAKAFPRFLHQYISAKNALPQVLSF